VIQTQGEQQDSRIIIKKKKRKEKFNRDFSGYLQWHDKYSNRNQKNYRKLIKLREYRIAVLYYLKYPAYNQNKEEKAIETNFVF
jgi:hypothetical protein